MTFYLIKSALSQSWGQAFNVWSSTFLFTSLLYLRLSVWCINGECWHECNSFAKKKQKLFFLLSSSKTWGLGVVHRWFISGSIRGLKENVKKAKKNFPPPNTESRCRIQLILCLPGKENNGGQKNIHSVSSRLWWLGINIISVDKRTLCGLTWFKWHSFVRPQSFN